MLLINSCKKDDDDTTAPVVTLTGASSMEVVLNSTSWTDPGATATDDKDGAVSVSSDRGASNPNLNRTGTYTITYSAQDAAGNKGIAYCQCVYTTRLKIMKLLTVVDTCGGTEIFSMLKHITVDQYANNRINFNKFADYANNTSIYATKSRRWQIEIPLQSATNIGSDGGQCDIADHTLQ
jgi:hypothetical protein